eukprot:11154491-Lingulodinium_polyedra.AAC.1
MLWNLMVAVYRQEETERLAAYRPLGYSACSLTQEDLERWQTHHELLNTSPERLSSLRARASQTPLPLSKEQGEGWDDFGLVDDSAPQATRPSCVG